jgi:hypothetical protein
MNPVIDNLQAEIDYRRDRIAGDFAMIHNRKIRTGRRWHRARNRANRAD